MMGDRHSDNSPHTSKDSPNYGFFDRRTITSMAVAGAMMLLTIFGMLATANTAPAELVLYLYSTLDILGVIVIGALLFAGRVLGLSGIGKDNMFMALSGSVILIGTYAVFGGAILTMYSSQIYIQGLVISGLITVGITIIAGAYVYSRDQSFEQWARYSGMCFIGGFVAVLIGSFFSPILIVGFILFLLGFMCDLVYEIWMTSNSNRDPKANGIALYIAFAGVFVHVLQLVLEMLARE